MSVQLSKTCISSFAGDIVTLSVTGAGDLSVRWKASDDSVVFIRRFADFSDGVLIALLREGSAVVTAECGGETLSCDVAVTARKTASVGDVLSPYFGDFHSHTTTDHQMPTFLKRGAEDQPCNSMKQVRDEGFYDCFAVTDHAGIIDDREFFRLMVQAEECATPAFIPFPGSESEVEQIDYDRYGVKHKSGEVVTFNACGYAGVDTWDEYFAQTAGGAASIGCFAHPQIYGYSVPGIWDIRPTERTTPAHLERFHMIELGNGTDREANLINERIYSLCLDCGYVMGPAMNGDSHGKIWGKNALPGRTVIWAVEKSKEAFLDALLHARFYATESGDVKLSYTVNGHRAPHTLSLTNRYDFCVSIGSFGANVPQTLLQVISDGGNVVYETPLNGEGTVKFSVSSGTARWFFLRLYDADGKRTWSMPVWTSRPFDPIPAKKPDLREIDKAGIAVSGCCDAAKLCSGDVHAEWTADAPEADVTFDLGRSRDVAAIGYYPHIPAGRKSDITMMQQNARFADGIVFSVSDDGENWKPAGQCHLRVYGGETVIPFGQTARYVRMHFRSVGSAGRNPAYLQEPVSVGEITFFENGAQT